MKDFRRRVSVGDLQGSQQSRKLVGREYGEPLICSRGGAHDAAT